MTTLFLKDEARYCKCCFNEIKINSLHSFIDKDICICAKCLNELSPKIKMKKINGILGLFLYEYNDKIKENIYRLKGCGDIELASIFFSYFLLELKIKYHGYIIVPSPSFSSHDEARGFNHVEEIAKSLNLEIVPILKKKIDFKQSSLTAKERTEVKDKIELISNKKIYKKKVLFIDDIYTTGSTLKACLEKLKRGQPRKLNFLVVSRVLKK